MKSFDMEWGTENQNGDIGVLASRCGLPFRGIERPVRDAGSATSIEEWTGVEASMEIAWGRDVSWQQPIHIAN